MSPTFPRCRETIRDQVVVWGRDETDGSAKKDSNLFVGAFADAGPSYAKLVLRRAQVGRADRAEPRVNLILRFIITVTFFSNSHASRAARPSTTENLSKSLEPAGNGPEKKGTPLRSGVTSIGLNASIALIALTAAADLFAFLNQRKQMHCCLLKTD